MVLWGRLFGILHEMPTIPALLSIGRNLNAEPYPLHAYPLPPDQDQGAMGRLLQMRPYSAAIGLTFIPYNSKGPFLTLYSRHRTIIGLHE